ncbi:FmdE family protein [Pyrococcus abyssi]|uniref:FwdE-like tungsten formylmethanofuran dehydrogenase, subunit E homolog n=1 Tax=Pyrococcus abyssi (strain GE5 / Orsay) TaxID=272844 RepID=Q9UZY9_PYRAB|nr:FmdE family protein [Pyrococcus abyssi]CAB49917.1 fwdE-like tungsten formylmethanofuran dehydrogenase, subunit E homolog [Pyrococcus abyssi GE5]CCE70415.1 TPA: molybdenum formylmethanofuran dehydrogenas e subunit fmde related [Pyrococcus abyssi GE5]
MGKLNELVERGDAEGILNYAREFHGHVCPYLALGIRASLIAMEELGVGRLDYSGSVDESILAIVETNSCFTDGVQVTTGCTLGNNSLIYIDVGKTALTLVKRGSWEGVRVYVDAEKLRSYYPPEATELFEKVVKERRGTSEEREKLRELWEELGRKFLYLPRKVFEIKRIKVPPIEQAPIFESVRCSECGELVMSPKVVYVNEKPLCKVCANKKILAVIGRGIVELEGFRV